MNSMRAWLRIFRLHNAAIAGAGVWLGWFSLRTARPDIMAAVWGFVSMALLVMAGNADNDVLDLETDRINRPARPLPAGWLKVSTVRFSAFLLYGLGVAAACAVSSAHSALAAGMALLLLIYNRRLKSVALAGNLAVSLLCALAIYFPEFPHLPHATLPACVFAFLATLTREIVKDAEDVKGDRAAGLRTLPIVWSLEAARKLAFSGVAILLAFLPLPAFFFGYRWPYLVLATALAAPFLAALLVELSRSGADYGQCQRHLKWAMLGGMAALLAGVNR